MDGYDQQGHHATICAQLAMGRHQDARQAHAVYEQRMAEIGVPAMALAAISPGTARS